MERFLGAPRRPIVLIVEDDLLTSMTVEDIITDAGFDFEGAVNAADAIAALEKSGTRFSALITDIRMPGKATDGTSATALMNCCPCCQSPT